MKRRTLAILLAVAAASVALAGSILAAWLTRPRPMITVSGTVQVHEVQDTTCDSSYDGIQSGISVLVTDPSNRIVGGGQLGSHKSTIDPTRVNGILIGDTICTFSFSITNVPPGKKFYGLTVGVRPTVHLTEADLHHTVKLS